MLDNDLIDAGQAHEIAIDEIRRAPKILRNGNAVTYQPASFDMLSKAMNRWYTRRR